MPRTNTSTRSHALPGGEVHKTASGSTSFLFFIYLFFFLHQCTLPSFSAILHRVVKNPLYSAGIHEQVRTSPNGSSVQSLNSHRRVS